MLRANNIEKSYGSLKVLKGIDINIDAGEIVTIVGKSGSGKSTLLHMLSTLDKPDKGEVYFDDLNINSLSEKELNQFRNEKIGFIFQFHHLLAEFNALENVSIPGMIQKGGDSKRIEKRAKELLDYLGLSERLDHKPSQLSGGEQQRVAVARALMNEPKVVFADEPTGNLDSQTSEELHQLFFQLRKDFNQTFVIVTHNDELAQKSDRCLRLLDGQFEK